MGGQGVKSRRPALARGGKLLLLTALWALAALGSLGLGAVALPPGDVAAMMLHRLPAAQALMGEAWWPQASEVILFQIRLPRVVLAGLVGASLAFSGAALQGLFRNPMAGPSVLGVSSGAALGAAWAVVAGWQGRIAGLGAVPLAAFGGALLSTALVYRLARVGGRVPVTRLLLAGVALGSFFSALVSLVIVFGERRASAVVFWLMGSLAGADWSGVTLVLPYFAAGLAVIAFHSRDLNAMVLGEEGAQHLGIDVERVKVRLLIATSLLTGAAVAVSGIIGFVGLVVPHGVRLIMGPDHRVLIPAAGLAGAAFLTAVDAAARTVIAPTEIPVGAITALIGGPFFLFLLHRRT